MHMIRENTSHYGRSKKQSRKWQSRPFQRMKMKKVGEVNFECMTQQQQERN
jgi:hypothetical protein